MKNKQRKRLVMLSWDLSSKPVAITLRLAGDHLLLIVIAFTNAKGLPQLCTSFELSKPETQSFFCDLARTLGYDLPSRRTPHVRTTIGTSRIKEQGQSDTIVIHGTFGHVEKLATTSMVSIDLTTRKALEILRALAPPLGWELSE